MKSILKKRLQMIALNSREREEASRDSIFPLKRNEFAFFDEDKEGIPPVRVESFDKYPDTKPSKTEPGKYTTIAINKIKGRNYNDTPLGEKLEDLAVRRKLFKERGSRTTDSPFDNDVETFSETFMRKFGPKGLRPERITPQVGGFSRGTISLPLARKLAKLKTKLAAVPVTGTSVKINPEHGKIIADAYENMKHDPNHPAVKASYDALINETGQQFNKLLESGLKIDKIKTGENPYPSSKEMHDDVEKNNHLYYFPTAEGYGASEQSKNHPMLRPTEFKHEGQPMLANDVFRVVHDINGHHVGGKSGFGPKGEHQAYLTHKRMYSPLANKALFTETAGQNNYVNFGPNGEKNRADPKNTIYAEQKAGLMPEEIINGEYHNA